jgi:hypothetical protein
MEEVRCWMQVQIVGHRTILLFGAGALPSKVIEAEAAL